MKGKRFWAVIICFCMMAAVSMYSYASAANGEGNQCIISISVVGNGQVSYVQNGGNQSVKRQADASYSLGDNIVLTATPSDGYSFIYWVNEETNRVLCYEPTFKLTAATYMNLSAVFSSTGGDYHYVSYLTTSGVILKSGSFKIGRVVQGPIDTPKMDGFEFKGWSNTLTETQKSSETMFIYPVFGPDGQNAQVTMRINGVDTTNEYQKFTVATVQTSSGLGGKKFQYWQTVDDETGDVYVVSYYTSFSFYVVKDITLEAVYDNTAPTPVPVIRLVGDNPDFDENKLYFYEEFCIPSDYTVVQHGIILTKNHTLANSDNGEGFVIGAPGVAKGTATATTAKTGLYSLNLYPWGAEEEIDNDFVMSYPIIYARAYLIVKDKSGKLLDTIYSTIDHANYLDYVPEENNYEDPFA